MERDAERGVCWDVWGEVGVGTDNDGDAGADHLCHAPLGIDNVVGEGLMRIVDDRLHHDQGRYDTTTVGDQA